MTEARDDIIETAAKLLEKQGYHATGLNQIVSESGAPKGSLYYYFPDGKEQICAEAVRRTGEEIEQNIRETLDRADSAAEGLVDLLSTIAERIESSDFREGGPLTTVALESAATHARLNAACSDVYEQWERAFRDHLVADGIEPETAGCLARTIVSSIEGAMVLCRTHRSRDPLEDAAELLRQLVTDATP